MELLNQTSDWDRNIWTVLAEKRSSRAFWQNVKKEMPSEQDIANLGLSMSNIMPSTAAVERVLSVMGWLTDGKRNRTTEERMHKLTVVHKHLKGKEEGENELSQEEDGEGDFSDTDNENDDPEFSLLN